MRSKAEQADADHPDTIPKLLLHHARVRPDRPAMREKKYGIWRCWTWREVAGEIRSLALGLSTLGLARGDRLAVIGDNRPALYWSMVAAQALGAVPVPLYQDASTSELACVLQQAEVCIVVAEDQEQIDKVLELKESCPHLEEILFVDPRGLRNYRQPFLHDLADVLAAGRAREREEPDVFPSEIGRGKGTDPAGIYYTAGTGGPPKGVILSFSNILATCQAVADFEGLTEREEVLAYLPMAWIADQMISVGQAYCVGFCVSCPESPATVMQDMREIGPTYFFAPPQIWETICASVSLRMEDAGVLKRWLYRSFMLLAGRVGARILMGESVGFRRRLLYRLGEHLIYGPLKNMLGMSRIRLAYTSGEAIGAEAFNFYRSVGVNIKQLYGTTEGSMFVTIQSDSEVTADTVGRPLAGVDLRISDEGEVWFRSPGVFVEYHNDRAATRMAKTADGWVHTGDAGFIDAQGHLRIVDRVTDIGRLADGTLFAPKRLENRFRSTAYIRDIIAFGGGRDYAAVFVSIHAGAVGNWAERHGITYTSRSELAVRPEIRDLIRDAIETVNRDLAHDPALAGLQVRRFVILHKDLDPDDGELTRTRKLRRRFVAEKYAALIEALYADQDECEIETSAMAKSERQGMRRERFAIMEAKAADLPQDVAERSCRESAISR